MLLCQPPVAPVRTLLSSLVGGSIHAEPIQSAVPPPYLSSMMTSGPPGAGLGGGEKRDLLPGSRFQKARGLQACTTMWQACVWGPDMLLPTHGLQP